MATYLQVSIDVAERVACGELTAADELPGVRPHRASRQAAGADPSVAPRTGASDPQGNPAGVTGIAQLPGLRVARRPFGSGTRALLGRLLTGAGIPPESVTGPEAASHLEVAMAIASGQADAGLACAPPPPPST